MRETSIALLLSLCALMGCQAFDDYNYDGYELESQACRNGGCTWSMRFGDDQDQSPRAVALDEVGDVFLAGAYNGHFDFKDSNVASPQAFIKSPFVLEFDPRGKANCVHTLDSGVGGEALAVVAAGPKLLWGGFTAPEGTTESAFLRIDHSCSTAAPIFTKLSGTGTGTVNALVMANDFSTVHVAGTVQGLGTIDCTSEAPAFDSMLPHLFLAQVDVTTGKCLRARVYAGGNHVPDSIRMLTGTPGRLIVAGTYTGGLEGSTLPVQSQDAAFLLSIDDATGNIVSSNVFRARDNLPGEYVKMKSISSAGGHLIIAGEHRSQVLVDRYDMPTLASPSEDIDAFVLALDPASFAQKWSYSIHGVQGQEVTAIASPDSKRLVLSGMFDSTLVFQGKESEPVQCDLPRCAFLAKLNGLSTAPVREDVTIVGRNELVAGASGMLAANAAGTVWTFGTSVEIVVDPSTILPPTQFIGDLDIVLSKVGPVQ